MAVFGDWKNEIRCAIIAFDFIRRRRSLNIIKDKKKREAVAACVIVLLANLLLFLTIWLLDRYDRVSLEQLLYQMQTSVSGTNKSLASSAVLRIGLLGFLLTAFDVALYLLLSGRVEEKLKSWKLYHAYCNSRVCRFFSKRKRELRKHQ